MSEPGDLGEIDAEDYDGPELPFPDDRMGNATPSWHSLPAVAPPLVWGGDVALARKTTHVMIEHIENPKALTTLFGEGFDIVEVDLHEVIVHRDGPSLKLRFDIPQVPRNRPARWPAGANTTQIVLHASPIERLQIVGFATVCSGVMHTLIDQGIQVLEFHASSSSVKCSFSQLRVESIAGYINA